MKPTRIFLDLDDVLNHFTMPALYRVGCCAGRLSSNRYNPEWGWDIVRAANALHPSRTFTTNEFWESLDRHFWAYLPKSREFHRLLDTAISCVGDNNVHIISSPTLDPDCLAGKLDWIQRNMPLALQRNFLLGPSKHLCARPDALLIDDRDFNVKTFRDHGGRAILVPRPWNSLHALSAEPYIWETLAATFTPPHMRHFP